MIENLVRILKTNPTSFSYRKWLSRPELSNLDRYLSRWCLKQTDFYRFSITICPCLYFDCSTHFSKEF